MEKLTQTDLVLNYIKQFGSISAMEAFADLGVTRLSARIFELRAMNHRISTTYETRKNRIGNAVTYARYRLERGN